MTVYNEAMNDIEDYFSYVVKDGETWIVKGIHLFTKKQKRLNRELGVHKVNKQGNILNTKKNGNATRR